MHFPNCMNSIRFPDFIAVGDVLPAVCRLLHHYDDQQSADKKYRMQPARHYSRGPPSRGKRIFCRLAAAQKTDDGRSFAVHGPLTHKFFKQLYRLYKVACAWGTSFLRALTTIFSFDLLYDVTDVGRNSNAQCWKILLPISLSLGVSFDLGNARRH